MSVKENPINYGATFKQYRERTGLTLNQAAEHTGVNRVTILHIEHGVTTRPTSGTVMLMLEAYTRLSPMPEVPLYSIDGRQYQLAQDRKSITITDLSRREKRIPVPRIQAQILSHLMTIPHRVFNERELFTGVHPQSGNLIDLTDAQKLLKTHMTHLRNNLGLPICNVEALGYSIMSQDQFVERVRNGGIPQSESQQTQTEDGTHIIYFSNRSLIHTSLMPDGLFQQLTPTERLIYETLSDDPQILISDESFLRILDQSRRNGYITGEIKNHVSHLRRKFGVIRGQSNKRVIYHRYGGYSLSPNPKSEL
jgi:DNA-binding response OmpR family regulator/DNA-binding XRE family transcriptional regulator